MKPYPPLGILYICSHLRKKGLNVEVFDSTFSSRQDLWDLLKKGPPSVIGIYANLMTRSNVIEILRAAKQAGWRTLVGGPEPGAYVQEYLAAGADVVVIGEGELTLEGVSSGAAGQRIRHSSTRLTGSPFSGLTDLWFAPNRGNKSKISMPSPGPLANRSTLRDMSRSGAHTTGWDPFL